MAEKKNVYFIRHAESDANVNHVFSPPDTPLTDAGAKQADSILTQCKQIPIDVIVASDYLRTVQTAEHLNEVAHKGVVKTPLFRERTFPSEIIGKKKDNPDVQKVLDALRNESADPSWHYGNEESFNEFKERITDALAFVGKREEENILVVTHSNTLKMILSLIVCQGKELTPDLFYTFYDNLATYNTGITYTTLEEDQWTLVTWNNFTHLSQVRDLS